MSSDEPPSPHRHKGNSKLDLTHVAIFVLLGVSIMLGFSNAIVLHENQGSIKQEIDQLVQGEQRLLANNYLITSNNALLLHQSAQHEQELGKMTEANNILVARTPLFKDIFKRFHEHEKIFDNINQTQTANLAHIVAAHQAAVEAKAAATLNQQTLNKILAAIISATHACSAGHPRC